MLNTITNVGATNPEMAQVHEDMAQAMIRLGRQAIDFGTNDSPYINGEHLDVLIATSLGKKDTQIAEEIGRVPSTVSAYRSESLRMLGAQSVEDGVRITFIRGLLPPDESIDSLEFNRPFTDRERGTLQEISRGVSPEDIASKYGFSNSNIRNVARRIFINTGAKNRAHAVRIGLEKGVLDPFSRVEDIRKTAGRISLEAVWILNDALPRNYRDFMMNELDVITASSSRSPSKRLSKLLIDREGEEILYDEAADIVFPYKYGRTKDIVKIAHTLHKESFRQMLASQGYGIEIKEVKIAPEDRRITSSKLTRAAVVCSRLDAHESQDSYLRALHPQSAEEGEFISRISGLVYNLANRGTQDNGTFELPKFPVSDRRMARFLLENRIIDLRQYLDKSPLDMNGMVFATLLKAPRLRGSFLDSSTPERLEEIVNATIGLRAQRFKSGRKLT